MSREPYEVRYRDFYGKAHTTVVHADDSQEARTVAWSTTEDIRKILDIRKADGSE